MGFPEDFKKGLDRQRATEGRRAPWLSPRAWGWSTRIAIGILLLLVLLTLTADLAFESRGPGWGGDRPSGEDAALPEREPGEPAPLPPRATFPA